MGTPVEPKPTKYFIAFLVADLSLAGGEAELSFKLGGIDARATTMAWQESKFYRGEMGRIFGAASGHCSRCAAR